MQATDQENRESDGQWRRGSRRNDQETRQTERESRTVKQHCRNNQVPIKVVYFDARRDVGLGPLGSELMAR